MSQKRKVEVVINGQTHGFMVDDDESYIQELAKYVNNKVIEVAGSPSGKLLPVDKKYIFTAMNIADDFYVTKAKYEELKNSKGNENSAEDNGRIEQLQDENFFFMKRIKSLEYELEYIQDLYNKQNAELEKLKDEYEQLEQLLEAATAPFEDIFTTDVMNNE